jgi:hypothetical protein
MAAGVEEIPDPVASLSRALVASLSQRAMGRKSGAGRGRHAESAQREIQNGWGRRKRLCSAGEGEAKIGKELLFQRLKGVVCCVWAYGLTLRIEEVGLWRNTTKEYGAVPVIWIDDSSFSVAESLHC